jgi:hypothetical protein
MRRIVDAACGADETVCAALLEAFGALANPPGEQDTLAAARRALAGAKDGGEAFAASGVRELEIRLNAALGRSVGELPPPDLSAYRAQPRSGR